MRLLALAMMVVGCADGDLVDSSVDDSGAPGVVISTSVETYTCQGLEWWEPLAEKDPAVLPWKGTGCFEDAAIGCEDYTLFGVGSDPSLFFQILTWYSEDDVDGAGNTPPNTLWDGPGWYVSCRAHWVNEAPLIGYPWTITWAAEQ